MALSIKWTIAQKAELNWWKRYLRNKPTQTYLDWKLQYWKDLLQKISPQLPVKTSSSILDMGCGPAGIYMALDGHNVTSVDPLIEEYQSNLNHFDPGFYPHVSFIKSSIENYVPVSKFDLVFCMNAINHVRDINDGFTKLASCVKPGGRLVITIDTHNYHLLKRGFRIVPLDILHPHQYDLEEYKSMVVQAGLTITQNLKLKSRKIFDYHLLIAEK